MDNNNNTKIALSKEEKLTIIDNDTLTRERSRGRKIF